MADLGAAVAHERAGSLERDLGAGPQVDDEPDADRVDERADVGGREALEVVGAQQDAGGRRPAVVERQAAEVADVDRALEADPACAHPSSLRTGRGSTSRPGDRGYPRPMTLRRLILLPVLLAALVAVGGCGGDDEGSGGGASSTADFCGDVKKILDANSDAQGEPTDINAFGKAIDQLQKLQPPDEIADDFHTVMDAYEAQKPEDIDQAKVQAAGKRLTPWLEKNCKVSA